MKKYGLRLLVSLITFAISITFVWINWTKETNYKVYELVQMPIQKADVSVSPNGKIEIRFKDYGRIENRPTLIFEIINHNSDSAEYMSFQEKNISPFVKFNGKEREEFRCGTGLRKFELKSGESFATELIADTYIFEFINKKGSFEFGFYFNFGQSDAKQIWSEPIIISDKLKKDIIKNAPDFLKQN